MAQVGSCCRIPSNFRRAIRNQYECSIATPRSNSACTLGSQEVGKTTLPSFSSCWPIAPLASAAVIRPAANKIRPDCVSIVSLLSGLRVMVRELARLIGYVAIGPKQLYRNGDVPVVTIKVRDDLLLPLNVADTANDVSLGLS